jgi:hypothetical protein
MKMKIAQTATSALLLTAVCLSAGPIVAAASPTAPAGGQIRIFATPLIGGRGTIVITGAVADFGTTSAEGNYVKVKLHHGTFELDAATLFAKEGTSAPALDLATCSGVSSVSGSVVLTHGAGLYHGIAGTINAVVTIASIAPRYGNGPHKGQCNNDAAPVAYYSSVTGWGTVHFA